MSTIVITEFMEDAAVQRLASRYPVHYDPTLVDRREALFPLLKDCRAIIVRNRTQVDRELLLNSPQLLGVGRLGVGLDNIDLAACETRNIRVMPASGANADAVAEYVIAGLLILFRGAYHSTAAVLNGDWPRGQLQGREIVGKTLGLVGYGQIARAVAQRARALGMHIACFDPWLDENTLAAGDEPTRHDALDSLLAVADAVSLHVPLTEATQHLLDAPRLTLMKPAAILINSARGGVIDETALAAALQEGRLGGAMLDVFEQEPLPADSPLVGVPNLILSPHIAGLTAESNVRVSELTADNVLRLLESS